MARFKTKPFEIEAIQFNGDNVDELVEFTKGQFNWLLPEDRTDDPDCVAEVFDKLHSTWVGVKVNQWIIRGQKGEYYPCDPEIFEAKYEAVQPFMPRVISVGGESAEDRAARGGGDKDRGGVVTAPGTKSKLAGVIE